MISNASDYRYCDVSHINVRGNTMPQRGRGVSPLVLSAEDVASLYEGFHERLRLLGSGPTYYTKKGHQGGPVVHSSYFAARHGLHDPVCLASSIARLCRTAGCVDEKNALGLPLRVFVTPDRTAAVSARKYPSARQAGDLGAVYSPETGWGHPILHELNLNQCIQPFNSVDPPYTPHVQLNRHIPGHTRLDVDMVRRAYDDLKQLRRLFLPMTVRYSKNKRLLAYEAVASGGEYSSLNDLGGGKKYKYYLTPVPALQPLILGHGDPSPAYFSFETVGCYCNEPNPRGDTCDALYVSRRSARAKRYATGKDIFSSVCCNDRFVLRAERSIPLRSFGAVDSYSPSAGEVVRVYALVRAWYCESHYTGDDWEQTPGAVDSCRHLVTPQKFLVSAATTNPHLPTSLIGEKACRSYLKKAGMPESIDEYPYRESYDVHTPITGMKDEDTVHGRACGVTLMGVWAVVEPKFSNLKIDVHNCNW